MEFGDAKLVYRLNHKDDKVWEELFNSYYESLCNHAYRILLDESVTEDIVQEVFFRLWCNRRGLREEGNLAALLYAMAKNLTVNAIRKHKIVETGNVRYYDLHEGRQEPAGESDSDETMRRLRRERRGDCKKIFQIPLENTRMGYYTRDQKYPNGVF